MIELWHLRNIAWLKALSESEMEGLRRAASLKIHSAGAAIFAPSPAPDTVFILGRGLVRIYRVGSSGSELTLGLIRPMEIFGELVLFDDGAARESHAEAMEDSEVLTVRRVSLLRAVRSHPAILFEIASQVAGRMKRLESRVEDLVFRGVRSRLARILLQLSEDFGRAEAGRIALDVKITHASIAKMVGTTRPTISLALGDLEAAGLVTRDRGRYVLLDATRLRQLARQHRFG